MAYIDPITGAFVADSLDALPPGYNVPKAGNEANVARMRAALNDTWENNTPVPDLTPVKTDPFSLVKKAYEHMPGAAIPQAAVAGLSDMLGGVAGNIYGVGKQILEGNIGDKNAGNRAFADAQRLAQALHYEPPTQAGRDVYDAYNKLGEITGPLPELWNTRMRFTPDDLRVLSKMGIEDVRNFPSDYANARAGIQREYPTMGSRAAQFTDVAGDLSRPLAEKAYEMYMNPERGVETYGLRPGANLSGLATAGGPMYAVKPKGGNWPTNLGSTLPLKEQGALGEHLSRVQYDDPVAVFQKQLEKHFPRGIDNRGLLNKWEDYLNGYLSVHAKGVEYSDPNGSAMQQLKQQAADKFTEQFNDQVHAKNYQLEEGQPHEKTLHSASDIAKNLPIYNAWVMGPYQKYITNQMGTGLATDPLLQAVNESGMPAYEIFGQKTPIDFEVDSITKRAQSTRDSFLSALFGYGDSPEKTNALKNTPIGKITATTPEGIAYENALDASLYPKGPYAFKGDRGETDQFPMVAKLDRNTLISDFLTRPEDRAGLKEIRKQVFQDLISGRLDPNKISNVTPATVTRQMIKDKLAEFKEAQLSKKGAADWIPKRAAAMPTDMAFPDGSKMTIITPEMAKADEAMTARDLGQITIDLNQCVGAGCHATQDYSGHGPYLVPHTGKPPRGNVEYDKYGYLRRLKAGDIEIASLKDPQGVSQATIELKPEKKKPISSSQKEFAVGVWLEDNKTPADVKEFYDNKVKHGIDLATYWAVEKFPELQTRLENYNGKPKKSIDQIKGADNGDVEPEYSEHLRQWLNQNAADLTNVRDLSHVPNVHDLQDHYVAIDKLTSAHTDWSIEAVENLFHDLEDKELLPRFFTAEQFEDAANQLGVNLTEDPIHETQNTTSGTNDAGVGDAIMQTAYDDLVNTVHQHYEGVRDTMWNDPAEMRALANAIRANDGNLIGRELPYTQAFRNRLADVVEQRGVPNPNNRARELEEIANVAQNFEPEPEQRWEPERLTDMQRAVLDDNMQNYFAGNYNHLMPEDMEEPYATDTRILMGNQNDEARLPTGLHREIAGWLLDQDNNTVNIRRAIDQLQRQGAVGLDLTDIQAENILNMLVSWTERYPLAE